MKKQQRSWVAWILCYALGMAIIWFPSLLIVGHFILGLPYSELFTPVAVTVAVFMCFGPVLFWAQKGADRVTGNGFERLYIVGACFGAVIFILFSIYGWRLRLFSPTTAWLIGAVGSLILVPGGYLLHRKLILRH